MTAVLIERIAPQGDGVTAEQPPRYVPFTLPGERVRVDGAGERLQPAELLAPSPERVTPPCPHFGPGEPAAGRACGGCALQHWAEAPYLAWKVEQLRLLLARERLETELDAPIATPPGVRRRLALHARRGPRRDEALLGYKARKSWTLVPVEVCPIADPRLVAAFPALRRLAAPLLEHPKSAPTLHLTWTEAGLDVDLTGVEARQVGLSADARRRVAELAGQAGFARVTLAGEGLFQARTPTVSFGRARVVLPPGGFLQASAEAEAAMAGLVQAAVGEAARVADLYCGAGAFALRLAERASVLAADGAAEAVAALKAAVGATPGLKAVTAEVRDLDRRPLLAAELKRMDAVVFDPPRAGAAAQARQLAASVVPTVVAVSCNPATFVRDARVLIDGGYQLERVTPVDQFLWSPHIELVAIFRR